MNNSSSREKILLLLLICFVSTATENQSAAPVLHEIEDILWASANGFAPATSFSDVFRATLTLSRYVPRTRVGTASGKTCVEA
jgi:hypothetical protein